MFHALATRDTPEVMRKVVKDERSASLPCNLLVDRQGRVRARSFGAAMAKSKSGAFHEGTMTEADKARALTEHTEWATPVGEAFARALAAGLLEKA